MKDAHVDDFHNLIIHSIHVTDHTRTSKTNKYIAKSCLEYVFKWNLCLFGIWFTLFNQFDGHFIAE